MKILALYLPQYHETPENNEWWEPGFTEWTNMKRAESLMEGHYQPRIPLNNNYYDLTDVEVMRWQTEIARAHGVYGFCVYHYWFDGKLILEKPMENYLKEESIDFPYCFCWANDEWTNVWKGESDSIKTLAMNHYDNPKDWEDHFYYMLPFFRDRRYIKEDNRPVYFIYNPVKLSYRQMKNMMKLWNRLAKENGFAGIRFIYQAGNSFVTMSERQRRLFDYGAEYLPSLTEWNEKSKLSRFKLRLRFRAGQIIRSFKKTLLDKKLDDGADSKQSIKVMQDYDDQWQKALAMKHKWKNIIPGAFTDWDNTPRYKRGGKVIFGACPEKFRQYLEKQIARARDELGMDTILMFAWNEWSEGGYLEPDSKYGYGYLEAIKQALLDTDEWPEEYRPEAFKIRK